MEAAIVPCTELTKWAANPIIGRIKLAKLVFLEVQELDQLQGKEFPEGLVADGLQDETAILFDPAPLRVQSTTEKVMAEIMELLINPDIGKIGDFGMGGVGKTTIMMNINNKLVETKKNQYFNRIIWVTVSKDAGGVRAIQNKIAHELSRWEDEVRRAATLLEKLKRIDKFFIILDDLWEEITLQEVGIPQPDRENSSKILVTTRLLSVCDSIGSQKNVEAKCLSEEEAWDLFVAKAGDHILINNEPEIEVVAKQVGFVNVEVCRLPLSLLVVL